MPKQSAPARKADGKKKNKPAAPKGRTDSPKEPKPIRREIAAVTFLFLGIFSVIGYFNTQGWFIDIFCSFVKGLIGWGYYIFPPALLLSSWILFLHRGRPVRLRTVCAMLLPLLFGAMAHLWFGKPGFEDGLVASLYRTGAEMGSGGLFSGLLAISFESMFSIYGASPVFVLAFLFLGITSVNLTVASIVEKIKNRPRPAYEPEPPQEALPWEEAPPASRRRRQRVIDIPIDSDGEDGADFASEPKPSFFNTRPGVKTPDAVLSETAVSGEAAAKEGPDKRETFSPIDIPVDEPPLYTERPRESAEASARPAGPTVVEFSDPPKAEPPVKKLKKEEVLAERENVARSIESALGAEGGEYQYPPIDLLRQGGGMEVDGREEIALNRERLEAAVKSFGVSAAIINVTRGPTVTRYDMRLDSGVKLAKLTNLAGDIALSLGVSGVRIAPIPDMESTVGVEVPNKLVSTVFLREIIASNEFQKAQSRLTFAIGKDISGKPIVGNIAKLPHMLIAGTTGSGKSVCMNSLIVSLLYKSNPDEVRLIMIDPKMVELGIYNGIPHLFIPVVTDPKKAAGALQWAVVEMLRRYRLFSEGGVRDISGYNALQRRTGGDTIQQIVIVIDELADLMLVASKEVEESICRVAQMGRASGMHLIIATQRPSADVITGLMKANIPSRIAFAVSSAMESRIILDSQGAEKLIGAGDMLYSPIGTGKPQRIQGAFVSDSEREEVIRFVKGNSEPSYNEEILDQIERAAEEKGASGTSAEADGNDTLSDYDELLPQAVEVILDMNQASVSLLQRRLKLGYARAARIVDQMEEIGVVGVFEGSKPRQILMTKPQWQETRFGKESGPGGMAQLSMEDAEGYDDEEFANQDGEDYDEEGS